MNPVLALHATRRHTVLLTTLTYTYKASCAHEQKAHGHICIVGTVEGCGYGWPTKIRDAYRPI